MSYASARYGRPLRGLGLKRRPGLTKRRRGFAKIEDETLFNMVRDRIVSYLERSNERFPVRAEWYATEFNVPVHKITQIFMRLNHEGLMSRRSNERTDLPWNASYYYVRRR